MQRFDSELRALCVYIQEAHAIDTWPFGLEQKQKSTHTPEDRCQNACNFIRNENFQHPVLCDKPPKSEFNKIFAAWPLRFYILDPLPDGGAILSFIAQPVADQMKVSFIAQYLEKRFPNIE